MPSTFGKRNPTSQVYDFAFDFNLGLARRDSNNTSIRIDYSNIQGYWDSVVNSPGIQSRDLGRLENRFFAPTKLDWEKLYSDPSELQWGPDEDQIISKDLTLPIFWQSIEQCSVNGSDYGEGFGAYVQGKLDAKFLFGFSLVVSL